MSRGNQLMAWGLAVALMGASVPLPAQAAPTPNWGRIGSLIEHHAYRLARESLQGVMGELLGEDKNQATYWLGYAQRRMGDSSFLATLERIPRFSLWYPRAQREIASALRLAGQDLEADARLTRLADLLTGIEREQAWIELADSLFVRGNFREAQALYLRELSEGHGSEPREHAAYSLGWCYERQGNPARAIWSWKEALRIFPASSKAPDTRRMLSNQYLKLGKPLLASDELQALARQTGDPELEARARFVAGEGFAATNNWSLARSSYAQVKVGSRWSEPAEYAEAYARWQAGDAKGAKPALERWLARYATSSVRPAALYVLGRVQLDLGAPEAAQACFLQATRLGKSSYAELSHFGLAELDYNQDRFAACAEHARSLLTDYPASAQRGPARWLLAESLLALKQFPEAIACYKQLAEHEGDLSFLEGKGDAVTFRLGLALFRAGDFPAAASYLKDVSSGRYGEEALYWLAEATYRNGDYAGAQALYARFFKTYPGSAKASEAAYGEAYSAYQLKAYDRALRMFKVAASGLNAEGLKLDALMRLGALQLNSHDWAGAASTYDSLYTSKQDAQLLPDVLYGLAWATFRKGDAAQAAALAATFLERYPDHAHACRVRMIEGQVLFGQDRFSEAATLFQAVTDDPRSTPEEREDARSRLGAAYYNSKQYDQAIAIYQALYASSSLQDREGVAQMLAQARLAKGDLEGARQIALEHATGSVWAGDALGRIAQGYLEEHQPDEAIKALNAIENPTLEERYLLYQAHKAANNPEAALAALEAIAHVPGPHQVAWLAELGEAYLACSDPGRARQTYALLAKKQPNHPALLPGSLAIAASYLQSGADALALDAYQEVAQRFVTHHDVVAAAHAKVGQIELKRGNYPEAAVAYRQAEHAAPPGSAGAVQARYWLGYTLVEAHRYEDAAQELSKLRVPASVGREWQALAWLKQGEAYEHLRRWAEAAQLYKQLTANRQLPAVERGEASERLRWIAAHVSRRTP